MNANGIRLSDTDQNKIVDQTCTFHFLIPIGDLTKIRSARSSIKKTIGVVVNLLLGMSLNANNFIYIGLACKDCSRPSAV